MGGVTQGVNMDLVKNLRSTVKAKVDVFVQKSSPHEIKGLVFLYINIHKAPSR